MAKVNPDGLLLNTIFAVLGLIALTFILSIWRVKPFQIILGRLEKVQSELPYDKKLDLIYQKNEWYLINEILSFAEQSLDKQTEKIKVLDMESDTLIESIPSGLVIIDKFQSLKKTNLQFNKEFIKDKKIKEIDNAKLWKVFEETEVLELFKQAMFEIKVKKLNGFYHLASQHYFDIAVTPLVDSQGKVIGSLGIFHNVTLAKLTDKMRVDFVANVSHEMRTPLTSIKGYSQLLLAQVEQQDEELQTITKKIITNSDRLKELFDNLLKLSIIESKYELEFVQIDLNKIFKKVLATVKGKYLSKDIEVTKDFQAQFITGDTNLLEQVFSNLIDNSLKYASKKPILNLSSEEKNGHIIIIIEDNGVGIKDEHLKRIFERFYRVQEQSQELIEGTGLGLSIVKHIINKHHGTIRVESEIGKGTQFIMELPIPKA